MWQRARLPRGNVARWTVGRVEHRGVAGGQRGSAAGGTVGGTDVEGPPSPYAAGGAGPGLPLYL